MIAWGAVAHAAEHLVHQGDTLASIALAWDTDVPTLQQLNGLTGAALPPVGGTLLVPDRPGSATVPAVLASVVGTVRATDPNGQPVLARVGTALPVGSTVCTEPDSYATVRLAATRAGGHDDLYLSASSCVKVKTSSGADRNRQSRLSLSQGSVAVRRAEEGPGEVVVDTADGVAAGTGGGFRVHLEAGGRTRLEATDGALAVMGGGVERALAPGFGTRVVAGRAPDEPTPLPAAGVPSYPEDGSALLDPAFAWTAVPRALGYRLEFSTAPDFSETVMVEDVPGTAWTPDLLFLPFRGRGLWWRVASFDRTGFLGRPSSPRALSFPVGLEPPP